MPPVPYSPDVEQPLEHEQETIDQITGVVTDIAANVVRKHGHAMRATHAKAAGFVKGELAVEAGLPAELAQGLFARPGRYDVLIRYWQGPSEPSSDQASGQRGLALKVFGPHVPESRERTTQDWVLAPDPSFIAAQPGRSAGFTARPRVASGVASATRVPRPAFPLPSQELSTCPRSLLPYAPRAGSPVAGRRPAHWPPAPPWSSP